MLPYKHLHVFHKREILKQKKAITAFRSEIPLRKKSEESTLPDAGRCTGKGAVIFGRKLCLPPLERMRSGLGTKPFHPMESRNSKRHKRQKVIEDRIRSSDGCIADRPALPYPQKRSVSEGIPSGTLSLNMCRKS